MAVVRNNGPGTVEFQPSGSSYVVSAPDGRETARGVFTYAMPPRIAPGEVAYFVETLTALFASADELSAVTVDIAARATDRASTRLPIRDIVVTTSADGGVRVAGTVTNGGSAPLRSPYVGAVLFGIDGSPIAAVYDLTDLVGLAPGLEGKFETEYPGTGPVPPDDVGGTEVIAFDLADKG